MRKYIKVVWVLLLIFNFIPPMQVTAITYTPVSFDNIIFKPYLYSNGAAVLDPGSDVNPTASDMTSGISSGVGKLPTIYIASDASVENLFFRYRIKGDPFDVKGGFTSTTWLVQLWSGNQQIATIGLDGKSTSSDYVYVANGDGSIYTPVYSTDNTGKAVSGTRIVPTVNGQYFIDFQVPIAALNLSNIGLDITATTPLTLFYGTSQAANLSVINKEWLQDGSGNDADINDFYTLSGGFTDVSPSATSTFNTAQNTLSAPTVYPSVSIKGFCVTSGSDCSTYVTTPFSNDLVTVSGTVSNYSGTVTLSVAGQSTTVTSNNGVWYAPLASFIPDSNNSGTYLVTASIPLINLNQTITTSDTFVIETTTTDALTISGGYYKVVNNSSLSINGSYKTQNQGNDMKYQLNGGAWVNLTKVSSTSTWYSSSNLTLVEGQNTINVMLVNSQKDILASTQQIVTYIPSGGVSGSTSLPLNVSISAINGTNTQPGLVGTSVGSQSVEIQLDGNTIAIVKPNELGQWTMSSIEYPLPLGTYTFNAIVQSSDGRIAIDSISHTVNAVNLSIDNGANYTTSDLRPTISGSTNAANGTSLTVVVNGVTYNTTVTNGRWYIIPNSNLPSGSYTVTATVSGVSMSQNLTIVTSTPSITLTGSSTVDIVKGNTYTDAGAVATDALDGNIQNALVILNPVNTNVVGTYRVRFNVTNIYGNYATEVTRTVVVKPAALVALGSSLNAKTISISGGTAGAVVKLYDSNNIEIASATLDSNGEYIFTNVNLGSGYTAKQVINSISSASSNAVNVSGANAIPVINSVSNSTVLAINASTWTTPSTTASDVEDGNLSNSIQV